MLADEQVSLLNTNLATQADIAAIHRDIAAIHRDIAALRQETKAGLADIKSDLIKWLVGALIAQGGVIVAPLRFLQG